MNSNYESYLVIIALFVLAVPIAVLVYIKSRWNGGNKSGKTEAVTGGSVSVFFDKAGNVIVIPYVKDEYGKGKATKKIDRLQMPYGAEKLGAIVKNSLKGCINCTACTDMELFGRLGAADWTQFTRDKRNISVYFREGYGLVFNTTTRVLNGAYQFNVMGAEKVIPADTGDAELGSVLMELLGRCR